MTSEEVAFFIQASPVEEMGTDLRARLLALYVEAVDIDNTLFMITLDEDELWTLDSALYANEPFSNKLHPSGLPMLGLAIKLWREIALITGYYKERYADTDTYANANKDADEDAQSTARGATEG